MTFQPPTDHQQDGKFHISWKYTKRKSVQVVKISINVLYCKLLPFLQDVCLLQVTPILCLHTNCGLL